MKKKNFKKNYIEVKMRISPLNSMATSLPVTDEQKVAQYMAALEHPLKNEIDLLRTIIKQTDPSIRERIKWNAPSYYASADFLTFNHRMQDRVHLIFHHPAIAGIKSALLEGDYKDRRMCYFLNSSAIRKNKKELQRVIKALLQQMDH